MSAARLWLLAAGVDLIGFGLSVAAATLDRDAWGFVVFTAGAVVACLMMAWGPR